jgi:hypothetical protein
MTPARCGWDTSAMPAKTQAPHQPDHQRPSRHNTPPGRRQNPSCDAGGIAGATRAMTPKQWRALPQLHCHGTGQQPGQSRSLTGPRNCMPRQQQPVRRDLQRRCNKACVRVNMHAWGDALATCVKPHVWVNASARCVSAGPTHYEEANFGPEWKANKETYHKPTGGPSLRTTNRPTLCPPKRPRRRPTTSPTRQPKMHRPGV